MASFVDLSTDEQCASDLITYHCTLSKFDEEKAALFRKEREQYCSTNFKPLLEELVATPLEIGEASARDVSEHFNAACCLLCKLDAQSLKPCLLKFANTLAANTADGCPLRLKMLATLVNLFHTEHKCDLFLVYLRYAQRTDALSDVQPYLRKIDELAKKWGATPAQRAEMLLIAHTMAKARPDLRTVEYQILCNYLETLNGASAADLAAAKDQSIRACALAILLPEVYQCDKLLELSAVKALESMSEHRALLQLLQIYVKEDVQAFNRFAEQNPSVLSSLELDQEDCRRQIRLLSLATLGCAENKTVPYADVARKLLIDEADVEDWVISAVSTKIVTAKLNQISRTVTFESALLRSFDTDHWVGIQNKLNIWKKNVGCLIDLIQSTQHQAMSAQ